MYNPDKNIQVSIIYFNNIYFNLKAKEIINNQTQKSNQKKGKSKKCYVKKLTASKAKKNNFKTKICIKKTS